MNIVKVTGFYMQNKHGLTCESHDVIMHACMIMHDHHRLPLV